MRAWVVGSTRLVNWGLLVQQLQQQLGVVAVGRGEVLSVCQSTGRHLQQGLLALLAMPYKASSSSSSKQD